MWKLDGLQQTEKMLEGLFSLTRMGNRSEMALTQPVDSNEKYLVTAVFENVWDVGNFKTICKKHRCVTSINC